MSQRGMPYPMMSCPVFKLGSWPGDTMAQGLAGHFSVGGEQLHCALFVLYILLLLLLTLLVLV